MKASWLLFVSSLFVLILQVISQPKKPLGEWNKNQASEYPNPINDSLNCQMTRSSRFCDPNKMFDSSIKVHFAETLAELEGNDPKNLCSKDSRHIVLTFAILKKIGPLIVDYRAEAKLLAEKFRVLWNLGNCSVVVVASFQDDTSYIDAGEAVIQLLTKNFTDSVDKKMHEVYFMNQLYVEGVNETIEAYKTEVNRKTVPEDTVSGFPVITCIIVVVLLICIVLCIVLFIIKRGKKSQKTTTECASLTGKATA